MKKKTFAFPYVVWMVVFTVIPLVLIFFYAFVKKAPTGELTMSFEYVVRAFSAANLSVLGRSLFYALITTVICLLLAYPAALFLWQMKSKWGSVVNMLFVLPIWMNFLLRTYAWRALLDTGGPINQVIQWLGLPAQQLLYTEGAVIMGLVYNFLPFMLLPIYSVFSKIDPDYIQAAEDLGANRWQVLGKIIVPLTRPGIITGITMVFMPTVTMFVISRLLGGSHYMMFGDLLENQFMLLKDWNTGSALAIVMMVLLVVSMTVTRKYDKDKEENKLW